MEYAVELNQVTKKFKETVALNNVTVKFEKGKIHGVIGRNGSGKTVLFKCICGLLPITEGDLVVMGTHYGAGKKVPPKLGAIIETPGFLPNLSGFRNLYYLMQLSGQSNDDAIRNSMKLVGLDPNNKKAVGKYSLGMRQRLSLAQVIMEDPDLLILDEPMNGLDKSGVTEIRELLLSLKQQGKTILIASHNPDDTRILCDTLHEMDAGKLLPSTLRSIE